MTAIAWLLTSIFAQAAHCMQCCTCTTYERSQVLDGCGSHPHL